MRIICCIYKDFVRQLKAFLPSFCHLCAYEMSPGWGHLITWMDPCVGHLNGIFARVGRNLNNNPQKSQMPGGLPGGGGDVEALIWPIHYIPEKPLSSHLRHTIIDKIIEGGGDPLTMIFPSRFVDIANELNIPSAIVSKIYLRNSFVFLYCKSHWIHPLAMRHLIHNAFYKPAVFQAHKLFFDNI